MKLNIATNIRKYRKERGLTQEALASALGITAQTVSKWECDDGYPDIETLPEIADFFKITVDDLMGTRAEASFEEGCEFVRKYVTIHDPMDQVKYCEEYVRRFPGDFQIATHLIDSIMQLKEADRVAYLPMLKETCEKIYSECPVQWRRERAVEYMCIVCDDEEYDTWERKCVSGYEAHWSEVLEKRLWNRNRKEESLVRHGINNFALLCHFFGRNNRDGNDPLRAFRWQISRMKLLELLGIPDCWKGLYACTALTASWAQFRLGNKEEGYRWLDEAFMRYDVWDAIPEGTELDMGDPVLFGGIRTKKAPDGDIEWNITLPDGTKEHFGDAHVYSLHEKRDIWRMLKCWRDLDEMRREPRFQAYIERVKHLDPSAKG